MNSAQRAGLNKTKGGVQNDLNKRNILLKKYKWDD